MAGLLAWWARDATSVSEKERTSQGVRIIRIAGPRLRHLAGPLGKPPEPPLGLGSRLRAKQPW
jgi:hypothetical protein